MPLKYKLLLGSLALAGVAFILISTSRYGAGLSPDSVAYIGTARNLIKGVGFINFDGKPTVTWPPLYPALLAFLGWISGTDPLSLTKVINAPVFGLIVFISGVISFKHFSSNPILATVVTLAILVSTPLFDVSVMAWSEPLFILFALLGLYFSDSYLHKNTNKSLILLSLSVALASLTRYIGIMLIVWGTAVVFFSTHENIKIKIKRLAIFSIFSSLPLGLWLIRNLIVSNTLFGDRAASAFTLSQNISMMFDNLFAWYIPGRMAKQHLIQILIGIGAGFLLLFMLSRNWRRLTIQLRQTGAMILFVILYPVFLIFLLTTTANDQIDDRLLSPIYVPLTILGVLFVQGLVNSFQKRLSYKFLYSLLLTSVVVWLAYPIRSTVIDAKNTIKYGQGYSSKDWIDSQTVQYLRQHRELISECTLYTNDQPAAYILADLSLKRSPSKTRYHSQEIVNVTSSLRGTWPIENNACLVWFDKIYRGFLYSVPELQSIANLKLISQLDDGSIYTVSRK